MNKTALSTVIVAGGNAMIMGTGLLTTVVLMQNFNPDDFGVITTLIAVMSVLPVFMDFGTSPSLIRFAPWLKSKMNWQAHEQCFRSVFMIRLLLGGVLFFTGLVLIQPISELLLKISNYWAVLFALIGSLGVSFLQFFTNILQAEERFVPMTVLRLVEALSKLVIIIVILLLIPGFSSEYAVLIYAIAPFLAMASGLRLIPRNYTLGKIDFTIFSTFCKFSFWYMISTVCLMVFMNFDIFILAVLKSQEDVGYFGAGTKLASLLYVIVSAMNIVWMPKVSKCQNLTSLIIFLRKTIYASLLISVACIPFTFSGKFLISTLAQNQYLDAVPVFILSSWDHIVMIAFTPLMIALLAVNRPRLVALVTALEMILNIIGDLIWVPRYGASGAAAVTLGTRLMVGVASSIYVWWKLRSDSQFPREVF